MNPPPPPQTAIAILRRSTNEQENSLDVQRARIMADASFMNARIAAFIEETASGTTPFFDRPNTNAALESAREHNASLLLFAWLDRFSRNTRDGLNAIHRLRFDHELSCRFGDIGSGDSSDAMTHFTLTMALAAATFEPARMLERQRETIQQRLSQGLLVGKPPFGLRRQSDDPQLPGYKMVEQDPREQAILAQIITMHEAGDGSRAITTALDTATLTQPEFHPRSGRGKKWSRSTIEGILNRLNNPDSDPAG